MREIIEAIMADTTKAMLSYLPFLGWIFAIVFLVTEKKDKFVRFHAVQALFLVIAIIVLGMVPFFGWVASFGGFILLIVMMVKAYHGKKNKLPIVGELASTYAK